MSRSGADVPRGDKCEPLAEFLCHIKASYPPLNCDTQPFIFTGFWWLMSGGEATDGRWLTGFPELSLGFPLLPHIIDGGVWYQSSNLETLSHWWKWVLLFLWFAATCVMRTSVVTCGNGRSWAAVCFLLHWPDLRTEGMLGVEKQKSIAFASYALPARGAFIKRWQRVCFYITPHELWCWRERRTHSVRSTFQRDPVLFADAI